MSPKILQDKYLFRGLKKKDKDAFISSYDLYFDDIYRFIYFKVTSREEAEDLTSLVFLKTWEYIQNNELDPYKSLKSFLYKVARNLIIDHYRKKSTEKDVRSSEDLSALQMPDPAQDTAKIYELSDHYSFIGVKMLELKDEYREVIVLRYINEMSVAEIALVLEKSKGNVRVLIYRALKALKEIIDQEKTK